MDTSFAQKFAEVWANPSPEKFSVLLAEDVVLLQPHRPPIRGREAAAEDFRRLLTWLPTLHGIVDRAVEESGCVFIEWRMTFLVGNQTYAIPAVDRFVMEGGLVIERVVYFDQLALAAILLRRPSLWPGYVRYLFMALLNPHN